MSQPSLTAPNVNSRPALVRRGLWLNYATISYNAIEALVSLAAGIMAGSVTLVGFGIDSVIEVTASGAAQWRLRADLDHERRERVERITLGACARKRCARGGRHADVVMRLPVRHCPGRCRAQCARRLVVVRPGRGVGDGSHRCEGRRRRDPRAASV